MTGSTIHLLHARSLPQAPFLRIGQTGHQRLRQISEYKPVPEARRAEHFLPRMLDQAVRSARQAATLKFDNDQVQRLVGEAKARIIRLRDALGALHEADASTNEISRSRAPAFRGGHDVFGGNLTVLGGRQ